MACKLDVTSGSVWAGFAAVEVWGVRNFDLMITEEG